LTIDRAPRSERRALDVIQSLRHRVASHCSVKPDGRFVLSVIHPCCKRGLRRTRTERRRLQQHATIADGGQRAGERETSTLRVGWKNRRAMEQVTQWRFATGEFVGDRRSLGLRDVAIMPGYGRVFAPVIERLRD
jgi:hypothetical protein